MSFSFSVFIISMFIISSLLVFGYAHEDKVIAFENRLFSKISKKIKGGKAPCASKSEKENSAPSARRALHLTQPAQHIDFEFFNAA